MSFSLVKNLLSKSASLHASKRFSSKSEKCVEESIFAKVEQYPSVEVFDLIERFKADKNENKVNLSVGAYRDNEGKPWVLPIVRKVEQEIVDDERLNHEYLPILGNPKFVKLASELLLGKDSPAITEKRYFGVQSLSGNGAVRLAADFYFQKIGCKVVLLSEPAWENHEKIFRQAGFKDFRFYTYYDPEQRAVSIDGLLADLCVASEGSIVVLHPCAHNPTGCDPTQDQWKQICEVMLAKKLIPFFDIAYQGLATGNPDADAWPVRYFTEKGLEMLVAQSFSKNMGLYGERIGNLTAVLKDPKHVAAAQSQFTILVRTNYSNPPAFGSRIVERVLGCDSNRREWMKAIKIMSGRISCVRLNLAKKLIELETPGTWDFIMEQIGLFSYSGLTAKQCEKLTNDHHIYLLKNGRISFCGLNSKNIDYVAKSIKDVVTKK